MKTHHSSGPFHQVPTPSSDLRFIRYINDADGRIIAEVRYAADAEQKENLANASLLTASFDLFHALQLLMSSEHDDDCKFKFSPVNECPICASRRRQAAQHALDRATGKRK